MSPVDSKNIKNKELLIETSADPKAIITQNINGFNKMALEMMQHNNQKMINEFFEPDSTKHTDLINMHNNKVDQLNFLQMPNSVKIDAPRNSTVVDIRHPESHKLIDP